MKLEGVNSLSLSPNNSPIEGGEPSSLLGKEIIAQSFAQALMGQIEVSNDAKTQVGAPLPLQRMMMPEQRSCASETKGVLTPTGDDNDEKEIGALVEQPVATAYKKNEPLSLFNKVDAFKAALFALTNPQSAAIETNMIPDVMPRSKTSQGVIGTPISLPSTLSTEASPVQNRAGGVALTDVPLKHYEAKEGMPIETIVSGGLPPIMAIQAGQGFNGSVLENLEAAKKAGEDENQTTFVEAGREVALGTPLPALLSSLTGRPADAKITQDMSGVMVLNDKPQLEKAKLNRPIENATSEDSLLTDAPLQSMQDGQGFNGHVLGNLESTKKADGRENQNVLVEVEKEVGLGAIPLASLDLLTAATSSRPADIKMTQDMGSAIALNDKIQPEAAKLNTPIENATPGDVLLKDISLRQPIQEVAGLNVVVPENLDGTKKKLTTDTKTPILGVDKGMSGITSDTLPVHRPLDNRTDSLAIAKPLTHPDWGKDLGEQIIWMNNKSLSAAEFKLNPAHLGLISVRIDVNQDQTNILFTTQHADVKDAIEASVPKLREMLGTQQLNLVNVNISQNTTPDHGRPQSHAFFSPPENPESGLNDGVGTIEKLEHDQVIVSKGLLSLYV